MAHYAFLDENNVVTEVIVGRDENEGEYDWEQYYGAQRGQVCKRTSYNTYGGQHLLGGTPFRKNYASMGYKYDEDRDAFIPPKTFESWVFDEDTCRWEAPIERPNDGNEYVWDEEAIQWVVIK